MILSSGEPASTYQRGVVVVGGGGGVNRVNGG